MWFLRNLVWLVIMVLVVGFAVLNMRETASAVNLPGQVYRALPLNVALFAAFAIGMLLAFVLALFHVLQAHADLAALRREKAELARELDALRNLPLEGLRTEPGAGGAA